MKLQCADCDPESTLACAWRRRLTPYLKTCMPQILKPSDACVVAESFHLQKDPDMMSNDVLIPCGAGVELEHSGAGAMGLLQDAAEPRNEVGCALALLYVLLVSALVPGLEAHLCTAAFCK